MKKDLKYYKNNAEEDYLETPISVLRYIGLLERRINVLKIILIIVISFICSVSFFGGIYIGQKSKQTEIENRVKELNKECYSNQDIEYIIFKESQL